MPRPPLRTWWSSPYTGLFRAWGRLPGLPHDPDVVIWSGLLPRWSADGADLSVGGVGLDEDEAALAALGEAIERWQVRPMPSDGRVLSSVADWPLDEPPVEPSRWVLFHPEQYEHPGCPFLPLTARTVCHWVCCRDVATGDPAWVPEAFVYLEPPRGEAACPPGWNLMPSLSTGLSAGRGNHPTLLRGLQEVIERDALVGAWWGRYLLEEHGDVFAMLPPELVRRVTRPNLRYRFYRVRTPHAAHVTLVRLEGDDLDGPLISVGSACRETRASSWIKAILESIQGRSYARYLRRQRPVPGLLSEVPVDFAGHAVYYSLHPDRLARTPFASAIPGNEESDRVEGLAALRERVNRPVLARVLSPRVGDGWRVFRVLVPGMQPLHGHHGFPFLGGPLWSPRGVKEYLTVPPHPFP